MQALDLREWEVCRDQSRPEGLDQPGDVLTLRRSGSHVRVEGLNFPGRRALDNDLVALLIPADTRLVPRGGDYLEGDDRWA
jgi:hypothetical protein